MREQKRSGIRPLPILLAILVMALGAAAGIVCALWLTDDGVPGTALPRQGGASASAPAAGDEGPGTGTEGGDGLPALDSREEANYTAIPLPGEMRAMWISFLEWKQADFSSEEAFRADFAAMAENCKAMGLNTIIAAVRPFGDALYNSPTGAYVWSHVMDPEGKQGVDPGFDPLEIMCDEAHSRGLRLEAWINPYRISHPTNGPGALADENYAKQHPEWVREVAGGQWYDPGYPQVDTLVVEGVAEIVRYYEVDGIHFDDYFYPEGLDESFDAESHAEYGGGDGLAAWRRGNINQMVQDVYAAVKGNRASASFGISCQGNNENNYNQMYADVRQWMANAGYVDYVMPQLYWGFGYLTQSGRDQYAFANICDEWAFYPRAGEVKLYAGLGAYRIGLLKEDGTRDGLGDGGSGDQSEWESGHNLADMVAHLRGVEGFDGFALFRYEFMVQPGDTLSADERQALTTLLNG